MTTVLADAVEFCRAQLGIEVQDATAKIADMGIDSMELLSLYAFLARRTGGNLPDDAFSADYSLIRLVSAIEARTHRNDGLSPAAREAGPLFALNSSPKRIPSLANRYSYFLGRERCLAEWITCIGPIVLRHNLSSDLAASAAAALCRRFDSLRLVVRVEHDGTCVETVREDLPEDLVTEVTYRAGPSPAEFSEWLTQTTLAVRSDMARQQSLFRLVVARMCPDGPDRLILLVHHLAADGVSLRTLVEYLFAYVATGGQITAEEPPSYAEFCEEYWRANARGAAESANYWRSLPWSESQTGWLPADCKDSRNIERYTSYVERTTEFDRTQLRGNAQNSVLAALAVAVARAYTRVFGGSHLAISTVHHGRLPHYGERVREIVGWMNDVVPYVVDGKVETARSVAAAAYHSRHTSQLGSSFTYLKYLSKSNDALELSRLALPQVSINLTPGKSFPFNFSGIGHLDPSFSVEPPEPEEAQRVYLLSSGAWVSGNTLRLRWDFSSKLFSRSEIEQFTAGCLAEFRMASCA